MYDGGKIITGLIIFLALVTFPLWYTAASGDASYTPDPETPAQGNCIESKEYMNAWHMDMLDDWRDAVVRDANRVYVATDGKEHEMSLTMTCMNCHDDKEKFCDRCHTYLGVTPYCWDCHVVPNQQGRR